MKRLLTLSMLCGILTVAASAETLNFIGAASGKSKNVKIKYDGNWQTVRAGALKINIDGGDTLLAYCVDLDHWMKAGDSWEVNVLPSVSESNGFMAQNLFANHAESVSSKAQGAALQLAIWDSLYDNGDGLTSGSFQAKDLSNSIKNNYNTYVATRNSSPGQQYNYSFFEAVDHGQNNDQNQNLLYAEAVPEPTTLAVFAGLAALAARRRRKA